MKVVVIGGGASGLVAAIYASSQNEVILLEKNKICGKKISITGNGKCNFMNEDFTLDHFYSENKEQIPMIENPKEKILNLVRFHMHHLYIIILKMVTIILFLIKQQLFKML